MTQKIIGILGGAGPFAGVSLLTRVLSLSQTVYGCHRDADFPKILLLNFPFSEMLSEEVNPDQIQRELREALTQLRKNGASILAIACNTLHAFLKEEEEGLISLPKVLAREVQSLDTPPLVLCTSMSVKCDLHKRFFPCVYLNPRSQTLLDEAIDWILRGKEEKKILQRLLEILDGQKKTTVVLGCTELSLFADQLARCGKRIIDPLEIVARDLLINQKRK